MRLFFDTSFALLTYLVEWCRENGNGNGNSNGNDNDITLYLGEFYVLVSVFCVDQIGIGIGVHLLRRQLIRMPSDEDFEQISTSKRKALEGFGRLGSWLLVANFGWFRNADTHSRSHSQVSVVVWTRLSVEAR